MSSRTLASSVVFLWTLVIVVTFCCGARAAPEAFLRRQGDSVVPPVGLHDFEELGLSENSELDAKHREEMAALIELIQRYRKEFQQQNTDEDINGPDGGAPIVLNGYPNLPIPTSLQAKLFRSQEGVSKDETKRGSYMSLCHFKICNMGRKRNLRWNPWIRR